MKIFSKLVSTILGSSLLFFTPSLEAKASDGHEELWDTLQQVGITIVVNNTPHCREGTISGAYLPMDRTLIVCQDNRGPFTTKQIAWTRNDLDTLRHEAHHVVQDCLEGGMGDGYARPMFDDKQEFNQFVQSALNMAQIDNIIESYRRYGATDHVVLLELEAFAVAKDIDPELIADAIMNLCYP